MLIIVALDFKLEVELPPSLGYILKKLNYNLFRLPDSWLGIIKRPLLENNSKKSGRSYKEFSSSNYELGKDLTTTRALSKQIPDSFKPKSSCYGFLRAPVSKGHNCPTHRGGVINCTTFFEHENYEYKLLCRGELYFRLKGKHSFRTGPVIPKEPGLLFIVKLDESNVVAFCFEPSSRMLGEVNGHAEFLPVRTLVASSQEAHGLVYTPGQGCVFDWVYGNRSSSEYPWNYDLRYDNPLKHSLEGLDSVENIPSSDALGEIQVGFAHIELNTTGSQSADNAQPLPSLSSQPTLPFPLTPTPQSRAPAPIDTSVASKSVLRRTCVICNRVLRRPSALTIHMNAHLGVKPFHCNDCDYRSTNITNLQRHQQARHPASSSGGK
ncbi:hypothetical protein OPQ81_000328 [Rhizoctonia solani]|nr:hypothetical protein OPQ81_000328 [Rhizoctonia solani]